MTKILYPHLDLMDWPFRIVPDESFCTFLGDRRQLRSDLRALLNHLSRRDVSTIHVVWSWYGAGKTHALRYIGHLCAQEFKTLLPVYTEFPRGGKSFIDLYRTIIKAIDQDLLVLTYEDIAKSSTKSRLQRDLYRDFPDLSQALKILLMGSPQEQTLAMLWLRAESITMYDARRIGLTTRIDSQERAIQALTWIIHVLSWASDSDGRPTARLIWMVDEFQRIEDLGKAIRDLNGCLHSVLNRCPRSFTLILSFSGPPSHTLPPYMSKELADRMGVEKVMVLPPLTTDEAETFIQDVLDHFRPPEGVSISKAFPFDERSIRCGVGIIKSKVKDLRPRVIMQAFSAILEVAEPMISSQQMTRIDESFVRRILEDREFQNPESPQD